MAGTILSLSSQSERTRNTLHWFGIIILNEEHLDLISTELMYEKLASVKSSTAERAEL